MVADAEARVGLDVVAGELAEAGPAVEEARPAGDDVGDRVAPRRRRGAVERGGERVERVGGFGVEHGLGRTAGGERDGLVGHGGGG